MSITDLIPHAPQVGLFVAPSIPEDKLANALADYAKTTRKEEVLALFDATLMGSAKDGAVFTRDRLIFQNNDLQPVHEIRYEDIVQVDARRKLLGGRRLMLTVNRGKATFEIEMDFSGKPKASDYVLRFLREAMLRTDASVGPLSEKPASENRSDVPDEIGRDDQADEDLRRSDDATDVAVVSDVLENLRNDGLLSAADFEAMMRVINR